MNNENELKKDNLHPKLDKDLINAFDDFFKNTSYGTFTFIVQNSKAIGYDSLIKKRLTNS